MAKHSRICVTHVHILPELVHISEQNKNEASKWFCESSVGACFFHRVPALNGLSHIMLVWVLGLSHTVFVWVMTLGTL